MEGYLDLKHMIELLEKDRGLHICIHDIEGVTDCELLKIESENAMHASGFCEAAKSTADGYERCISHKNTANLKAVREKNPFCGYCPYGIFEAVKPVVIDERVVCIIYVGNVTLNREETRKRILKTCLESGVSTDLMLSEAENLICLDDEWICRQTADALDSMIRLLHEKTGVRQNNAYHWVIQRMMDYAEVNFDKNLTLKSMSMLYFMEEKYLGRLFKKQIGVSFNEYVNALRIKRAVRLLKQTKDKVIDIAHQCGYNNVTYFNRVFEKYYHMAPRAFRKENARKDLQFFEF